MEYRYKIEKRFSEISVIASEARITAKRTEDNVKAELELTIKKDENDKIVAMLNASANVITLKGNRISIESDNFNLAGDGTLKAKKGIFDDCDIDNCRMDNCTINETCKIKGKLTGNTLVSNEIEGATGALSFFNTSNGIYYDFNFSMSPFASGIRLGLNSWGGDNPSVFIYSETSTLTIGEKISASSLGDIELSASGKGILIGTWYYGGDEIPTKADLNALSERIAKLEGAKNE
jgi:hypothetical protein